MSCIWSATRSGTWGSKFPRCPHCTVVSRNNWTEQKEKAHSDSFVLGNRKWISLWLREMAIFFDNFYQPQTLFPPMAFCIPLSSTPRNFPKWGSAVESKRGLKADEQGWDAWSSDIKNEGTQLKETIRETPGVGNSRRNPGNAPPFLVSPPYPSGRAGLYCKEKGAEKTGSRGQSGEGNLYCISLNRENTQVPGTQITDNCWRNASLPSLSSILVIPGGTWTGKLPMIGFIRAIFRKMSEVNSSAIIPPQGSNNHYPECKWVKKNKKGGGGIMTVAFDRGTFWRLCPCKESEGETVSWKTKAITPE